MGANSPRDQEPLRTGDGPSIPGRCSGKIDDVIGTREGEMSRQDSTGNCHRGVKFRKEWKGLAEKFT